MNIIYCKKSCFKVENNIDFEFKKGEYYNVKKIGFKAYSDENEEYLVMIPKYFFMINGYEYKIHLDNNFFHKHFLSHEKTKRKLKLNRIKRKK